MGRLVGGTPEEDAHAQAMGHEPVRTGEHGDFYQECLDLLRESTRICDEVRLGHRRLTQTSDGAWYRYDESSGKLQAVNVYTVFNTYGGPIRYVQH